MIIKCNYWIRQVVLGIMLLGIHRVFAFNLVMTPAIEPWWENPAVYFFLLFSVFASAAMLVLFTLQWEDTQPLSKLFLNRARLTIIGILILLMVWGGFMAHFRSYSLPHWLFSCNYVYVFWIAALLARIFTKKSHRSTINSSLSNKKRTFLCIVESISVTLICAITYSFVGVTGFAGFNAVSSIVAFLVFILFFILPKIEFKFGITGATAQTYNIALIGVILGIMVLWFITALLFPTFYFERTISENAFFIERIFQYFYPFNGFLAIFLVQRLMINYN